MPVLVFILAAVIQPLLGVNWVTLEHDGITIRASGYERSISDCLDSSREAKLKFEVQLCRKRTAWFDACAEARVETHSISFDSITESYRVIVDRRGDRSEPIAVGIPSKLEAVQSMLTVEQAPLAFLARGEGKLLTDSRRYLQIRGIFSCKGSVTRTLARMSQLLTLGLLNVTESNSGWMYFEIDGGIAAPIRQEK